MDNSFFNKNKIDISLDNYFIKPYKCNNSNNLLVCENNDENDLNNIIKTLTSIILSNGNSDFTDKKIESNIVDTSLFEFVANNKITDIKKLISKKNTNINIQDNDGDTPLHIAVFMCNSDICEILLDNNANFNIKDKWGQCALHRICFCINNINIFKIIYNFNKYSSLNSNLNIFNQIDNFGNTPFHLVIKYFLKNNTSINEHHIKIINQLKNNTDCKIKNNENYSICDLLKILNL